MGSHRKQNANKEVIRMIMILLKLSIEGLFNSRFSTRLMLKICLKNDVQLYTTVRPYEQFSMAWSTVQGHRQNKICHVKLHFADHKITI